MHECSSLLIRCIDFRLTQAIDKWLEEKGIMNNCDIVSIAGAGKALAEDSKSNDAKVLLEQIKLSKQLHNISTVYLMHHTDCGAYGGRDNFENEVLEKDKHTENLNYAKQVIEENLEDVEVKCVLVEMKNDENMDFLEI